MRPLLESPVLFTIFITLAACAVTVTTHNRPLTSGVIIRSVLVGLVIGACVGIFMGNAATGLAFGGVVLVINGAAMSIRKFVDKRRTNKNERHA